MDESNMLFARVQDIECQTHSASYSTRLLDYLSCKTFKQHNGHDESNKNFENISDIIVCFRFYFSLEKVDVQEHLLRV